MWKVSRDKGMPHIKKNVKEAALSPHTQLRHGRRLRAVLAWPHGDTGPTCGGAQRHADHRAVGTVLDGTDENCVSPGLLTDYARPNQ